MACVMLFTSRQTRRGAHVRLVSATMGEPDMNFARRWGIAVIGLVLSAAVVSAQDMSRYRDYVLASTLESVVTSSGSRGADTKTIHERPAKIQELQWRAPYASSASTTADPVRGMTFSFVDDALFQIVVTYDRERTAGLTNREIIETLTAAYGAPVASSGKAPVRPTAAHPDTVVIAQWQNPEESLTLVRGTYEPEFQLILVSRALDARARQAARDAVRLDAAEAPSREAGQRRQEAADAAAVLEKTRATNKAAFRP